MFWNRVAGIYDLYQLMNRKVNNRAASICAKYISKDDVVLECACGTGIMTKTIAPYCKKIIATDCSKKMLCRAKHKLRALDNIRFCCADITNLKFKDSCFDIVLAANVIHLIKDPDKAIFELYRVVKPGGMILIPTYISREAYMSSHITKIFNKMGANFQHVFNSVTYRQFFENKGITADYHLAEGLIDGCVAIIKV